MSSGFTAGSVATIELIGSNGKVLETYEVRPAGAGSSFRFSDYYLRVKKDLESIDPKDLGAILTQSRNIQNAVKSLKANDFLNIKVGSASIKIKRGAVNSSSTTADMENYFSRFVAAVSVYLAEEVQFEDGANVINSFAIRDGLYYSDLISHRDDQTNKAGWKMYCLDTIGLRHAVTYDKVRDLCLALYVYRYKQAKEGNYKNSGKVMEAMNKDVERVRLSPQQTLTQALQNIPASSSVHVYVAILKNKKATLKESDGSTGSDALNAALAALNLM